MTELSGYPAATVHRLLQLRPGGDPSFDRDHPLDADLIVVDEASMLDLILANKLIKAVPPGAHLLLVGDVDQLPSVGAGEVLRDVLAADTIPRVRLTTIFRQAQESGVVVNAHRINAGQPPVFGEHPDFFLFPANEPEATPSGWSIWWPGGSRGSSASPRATSRCWRRCTAARPAPAR